MKSFQTLFLYMGKIMQSSDARTPNTRNCFKWLEISHLPFIILNTDVTKWSRFHPSFLILLFHPSFSLCSYHVALL